MALWVPNFNTIKRTAHNNARVEGQAGVLTELLFNVDATLRVNGYLKGVAGLCPLLVERHLTVADFFHRVPRRDLKGLGGQDVNTLVTAYG